MFVGKVELQDMDGFDVQTQEVIDAVNANISEVAEFVLTEANTSTAFKDKNIVLRPSLKKRKSKFENGGYIVFSPDPKAHLVEFGHVMIAWGKITGRRVPPHPFLRPAVDKGVRKAVELFREGK